MTDREFYRIFSGLMGVLVAVAVVLFILAHMVVSGSSLSRKTAAEQKAADKAIAERIKPVGEVAVGTNVMDGFIPPANAAGPGPAAGGASKGQSTYETACVACHGSGVMGAPKLGDKAAWKDRIAKGKPKLYESALKGFQGKVGFMPPKGGNPALKDEDVKAAVDYMVQKAQ